MLEDVRRDLARSVRGNQHATGPVHLVREIFRPGTQAVLLYRFGKWVSEIPVPGVRHALHMVYKILEYFCCWRVGISIPLEADIGPGMVIHTWGGGLFLPGCPIGRDLTVVGGGILMDFRTREIGDEVVLGAGCKIINRPSIGDRVRIAPNAVVDCDVPDDCVVFGNPGRVIGPIPRELKSAVEKTVRSGGEIRAAQGATMEATDGKPEPAANRE